MIVSRRVLARALAAQLLDGEPLAQLVPKLAAYLIDNRLTGQIDEVVGDIAYELSQNGVVEASVTTARPLTDELRAVVKQYIEQHETAPHIILNESIDPTLLGGIVVETPSSRLDASVATTLKKLKTT